MKNNLFNYLLSQKEEIINNLIKDYDIMTYNKAEVFFLKALGIKNNVIIEKANVSLSSIQKIMFDFLLRYDNPKNPRELLKFLRLDLLTNDITAPEDLWLPINQKQKKLSIL